LAEANGKGKLLPKILLRDTKANGKGKLPPIILLRDTKVNGKGITITYCFNYRWLQPTVYQPTIFGL